MKYLKKIFESLDDNESSFQEVDGKLVGSFKFKSQTELVDFLSKVAKHADKVKHHPDCKIHKAFQLEITLFTHDKNEITSLDRKLAKFIDSLKAKK
jgi:4a-hydroxytetrahydrobiopterin dehydratase